MTYLLRSFVLALLLLVSASSIEAQNQIIAYVDIEAILPNMPEYKRVESELTSYKKVLEKQIQAEEKKMKDYYESVMKQMQEGGLSPQQQKEAETKLAKMQEDLQKKAIDAEKQLVQKEQTLSKPLYDKFNGAIKTVAQSNNYAYVFDKKFMLYSDGGVDATGKLKAALGIP